MHDKYGREIEEGDVIVAKSWAHGYKDRAMKVIGCNANATSCNLTCIGFEPQVPPATLNANECVLVVKKCGSIVGLPEEDKAHGN